MIRHLRPRRIASVVVLTAAWCALWGTISFANIAGGVLLAIAVTALGVGTAGNGSIRLIPLLRLTVLVLIDLVKSTISVAHEIVTPTDTTDESIIAVDLPTQGKDHFLLLVVAITLTPGTAVVDADPATGRLYLHLLHDKRRQQTVDHVHEIAQLACDALPLRTAVGVVT